MITVLNKYIYQFTNKGSIKQIAIVVIETRQIALVFPLTLINAELAGAKSPSEINNS